jgi:hypothetical protein
MLSCPADRKNTPSLAIPPKCFCPPSGSAVVCSVAQSEVRTANLHDGSFYPCRLRCPDAVDMPVARSDACVVSEEGAARIERLRCPRIVPEALPPSVDRARLTVASRFFGSPRRW